MNLKKVISFSIFLSIILLTTISPGVLAEEDTITIAVLSDELHVKPFARLNGTDAYLSSEMPEFTFNMVPMDFDSMQEGLWSDEIDFVIVDPATYVTLEYSNGISNIATMETVAYLPPDYVVTGPLTSFLGSVIITENDREDIENLPDTTGLSFLVVETPSKEGWWLAKREFTEHRIFPENDFASLDFNNNPEEIVYSVLNGDYDVGIVPSGILERMYMEDKIDFDELKVVHTAEL